MYMKNFFSSSYIWFINRDLIHKNILKEVIREIGERFKITCILVSHDPQDILSWADEIIIMRDGQITQQGSPQDIYRKPSDEYTAGLFGKYSILPASILNGLSAVNGKKIFFRPEQLIITKENGIAAGVVKDVIFFGGYYEITIMLSEYAVTIKSQDGNYTKGDAVNISLASAGIRYM
jgi:ABC-type Fe3+/spermidine/putrescine transport system ATPase subunit